ncbi:hypothetical protein HanPSC8_Chr05g0207131 [Helianthus annuus]|nr:hypothetical protein HanPSC8_Chr05g0207131 [Helianthus annuus]
MLVEHETRVRMVLPHPILTVRVIPNSTVTFRKAPLHIIAG